MDDQVTQYFPVAFPIFFVTLWLAVTTLLSFMSGWFTLMDRYPDRIEKPLLQLSWQSGTMGWGVGLRGVLTLSACPSGLRVAIFRPFGIFARSFMVPWDEITVRRKNWLFMRVAELQFGRPKRGHLTIASHIADRLARAASVDWPEEGSFPREPIGQVVWMVFLQWLGLTTVAALFFSQAPRFMSDGKVPGVPLEIAIAFPAIVFGIASLIALFARLRN